MTGVYGEPNEPESIATIHRAIDLGMNLIVTSDAYGAGANEELVGRAIRGMRSQVLVASKFGNLGMGDSRSGGPYPGTSRLCCSGLRCVAQAPWCDMIDVYGLHRVDPRSRSRRRWAR